MKTWRFRLTKDGRLIDISLTVSPIKNESGEIIGASKIARHISESKRAQERLKLLLREMDHRVKNRFSLAISVLSLSGRSAKTAHGVVETASARLTALARAHALTLSHSHADLVDGAKPTTLHSLIRAIIAPHHEQETSGRFSITGSDVKVSASVISSLALLLHEFVTNATKYGALADVTSTADLQSFRLSTRRVLATFSFDRPSKASGERSTEIGITKASSFGFPCRVKALPRNQPQRR